VPALEEKVAFLKRPESYPERTRHVETKEKHMSWIFLTDTQAWKLKKPSKFDHLDLRSAEARRRNCDEEVRLNRRLAPDVYHGVVPLTVRTGAEREPGHSASAIARSLMEGAKPRVKRLQLDQPGIIDDWLVCMRRLPADRMLDVAIQKKTWLREDARRVGILLAGFYSDAAPLPMPTEVYVEQLKDELRSSRDELTKRKQDLNGELIESTVTRALTFIDRHFDLFDGRVCTGKIIEGHGDLRPEHICLEDKPVIIDCLEINRTLRIVDPASEFMFLLLECERLGAREVGDLVFATYCEQTRDNPPDDLLMFYRTYHATVRAKVAIWHLKDYAIRDFEKWVARAEQYLEMAA
jgi:uncharacterized protein